MTTRDAIDAFNAGLLTKPEARDIVLALADLHGLPVSPETPTPIGLEREGWDIPPAA